MTSPGPCLHRTRGWCWIKMTTSTRPRSYLLARTPTDPLQGILPLNTKKTKLSQILRTVKAQGRLSDATYRRLCHRWCSPPSLMDSLKFINTAPSLCPLFPAQVQAYGVAKELANILGPLVGIFLTTSETSNTLWNTSKSSNCNKQNVFLPMM